MGNTGFEDHGKGFSSVEWEVLTGILEGSSWQNFLMHMEDKDPMGAFKIAAFEAFMQGCETKYTKALRAGWKYWERGGFRGPTADAIMQKELDSDF